MNDKDLVFRGDVLAKAYHHPIDGRLIISAYDVENIHAVPHEMSAVEYMDALERLFVEDYYVYNAWCKLMLSTEGDKHENLHKAVAIVEAWVREHPKKKRKTYAEDFFEKFPDAPHSTKNGMVTDRPAACRMVIYGGNPLCIATDCDCAACWNAEMEVNNE